MREIRLSGSEGGGTKPIASPYPYFRSPASRTHSLSVSRCMSPHFFNSGEEVREAMEFLAELID